MKAPRAAKMQPWSKPFKPKNIPYTTFVNPPKVTKSVHKMFGLSTPPKTVKKPMAKKGGKSMMAKPKVKPLFKSPSSIKPFYSGLGKSVKSLFNNK